MADKALEARKPQLAELEANIRATIEAEGGSVTSDSFDLDRPGTSSTHHTLHDVHAMMLDETSQMSMRTTSEFSDGQQLREFEEMDDDIMLGRFCGYIPKWHLSPKWHPKRPFGLE